MVDAPQLPHGIAIGHNVRATDPLFESYEPQSFNDLCRRREHYERDASLQETSLVLGRRNSGPADCETRQTHDANQEGPNIPTEISCLILRLWGRWVSW